MTDQRQPDLASQDARAQQQANAARRSRLREFQTQLIERMRVARHGGGQAASQLGVTVGNQRWLLDLHHAGEVAQVGTIQPVPLTADWFLGLTNLRGELLAVTDLARFHGLPATPIDRYSRLVSFSPALGVQAAVLVTAVLGLRNVAGMTPYAAASATGAEGTGYIGRRYVDREEQLWTELDLAQLARDERFLDIGR